MIVNLHNDKCTLVDATNSVYALNLLSRQGYDKRKITWMKVLQNLNFSNIIK